MDLCLQKHDHENLRLIAEYRVLTTQQLAALSGANLRALQRRLRQLVAEELLATGQVGPALCLERGHPANWFALTSKAARLLQTFGVTTEPTSGNGERLASIEHQLLINDFRVALLQLPRTLPQLRTQFETPTAPIVVQDEDPPMAGVIPDGVAAITDAERHKTVLFYLEADLDTEPRTSERAECSSIDKKIRAYQSHFRVGGYKAYEQSWNCQLRGFRLLLMAHSASRMRNLCRLVRSMPPSSFIWLAHRARLLDEGLNRPIWARGGRDDPIRQFWGVYPPPV